MSLKHSDDEAALHASAPRVSLASMEAKIVFRFDATADELIDLHEAPASLAVLSICILVMHNGFTLIGKSAPADATNFNAEFGRKLAYEDAIRQLWPLEGYLLRERLAGSQ